MELAISVKCVRKRAVLRFIIASMQMANTLGNGEMQVTLKDIQDKFDALNCGSQPREAIAEYAMRAMEADDAGSLEIENNFSEKIWQAIVYLSGVDLQSEPNVYLHTANDFVDARRKLGVYQRPALQVATIAAGMAMSRALRLGRQVTVTALIRFTIRFPLNGNKFFETRYLQPCLRC
jgi:hypothetical protein